MDVSTPRERESVIQAVVAGMLVMLAGTIPRNILFEANLHFFPGVPWAVPAVAVYLWGFWRYLSGDGPPPRLPDDVRVEAARRYIQNFELVTGRAFEPDRRPPVARIAAALGAK